MQTIIAAFDNHAVSMSAVDRLAQAGFPRSGVHVEHGTEEHGDASSGHGNGAQPRHEGFFAGIEDFFGGLFGSSSEGHSYAEAVRRGGHVVVVDAANDDEAGKAKALLYELGAIDVEERASQWKKEGWRGAGADSVSDTASDTGYQAEGNSRTDDQSVVPIVQEDLKIGKRKVEGGGVRVVSRITETPVSELVRLRQERATVERRAVDRPATDADFANFKEGEVEVRETSEEAVVAKTARVVEEVVVGKTVSERSQTVTDTVRKTDVQVERLDDTNSPASDASGVFSGTAPDATPGNEAGRAGTRDGEIARGKSRAASANRDPLTGAAGAHPVGTGIGAALGGAAAGAATGTVAGPVGTVIGAAVGAVAGGLAGKGIAEAIDPTQEDAYWRENYASRPYVAPGSKYDDYGPAYLYGVDAFSKHPNRHFDDVQDDLGRDWNAARGTSSLEWDRARSATRDAWDRLGRSNR